MTCGKIVQLLKCSDREGYEVFYGSDARHDIRELGFCKIAYNNTSPKATKTYIKGGYLLGNVINKAKEILVLNGELSRNDKEEMLLVIIPKAGYIMTNSKKIAGRNHHEAVLEMRNGDLLEVSDKIRKKAEKYIVVQAENEMFLIKKNR